MAGAGKSRLLSGAQLAASTCITGYPNVGCIASQIVQTCVANITRPEILMSAQARIDASCKGRDKLTHNKRRLKRLEDIRHRIAQMIEENQQLISYSHAKPIQ